MEHNTQLAVIPRGIIGDMVMDRRTDAQIKAYLRSKLRHYKAAAATAVKIVEGGREIEIYDDAGVLVGYIDGNIAEIKAIPNLYAAVRYVQVTASRVRRD